MCYSDADRTILDELRKCAQSQTRKLEIQSGIEPLKQSIDQITEQLSVVQEYVTVRSSIFIIRRLHLSHRTWSRAKRSQMRPLAVSWPTSSTRSHAPTQRCLRRCSIQMWTICWWCCTCHNWPMSNSRSTRSSSWRSKWSFHVYRAVTRSLMSSLTLWLFCVSALLTVFAIMVGHGTASSPLSLEPGAPKSVFTQHAFRCALSRVKHRQLA